MSKANDWQPPPCKHGVKPLIEVGQPIELLFASGAPTRYLPGRNDFAYDCPTPGECKWEVWKQASGE